MRDASCLSGFPELTRRGFFGASAGAALLGAGLGCSPQLEDAVRSRPPAKPGERSFVVAGGFVLPMRADRAYFPNGAVAVVDGRIEAVGPEREVVEAHPTLNVVDASGALVLPGFVDTHIHDWYALRADGGLPDFNAEHRHSSFSRGGDLLGIAQFGLILEQVMNRLIGDEERHATSLLLCLDLLRSGTTCIADAGSGPAGPLAQALIDTGLRGAVSDLMSDVLLEPDGSTARRHDADERAAELEATLARWKGKLPRIRVIANMIVHLFASDDLWANVREIAQREQLKISTHIAALSSERETSQRYFGVDPVERLERLGVLDVHLLACHMGFVEGDEIERVAKSGCGCNYAPVGSGTIGVRYPADNVHPKLWRAGAKVAVASDGGRQQPATMLDCARTAYLTHNIAGNDEAIVSRYKALELATIDAARVLGWDDEIGSLEVGKRADIVLHDVSDERYDGLPHPLTVFLLRGQRADVRTVIVDGEIVLEDGQPTRLDVDALRKNALGVMTAMGTRIEAARSVASVVGG